MAMVMLMLLAVNPVPVVVLDPALVGGATAGQGSLIVEEVARALPPVAFKVTTSSQLAAVLGLERQRQLLGCGETSCIAELAGALGARAIVSGELTRVGTVFQLSVKVLDATSAAPIYSALERHDDSSALLAATDRLALDATQAVARRFGLVTERLNPGPLVGLGVSAALLAGGGVLLGLSAGDADALRRQQPADYDAALATRDAGEMKQGVGVSLVGLGGAAAIGSILWLALKPKVEAPLAVALGPAGVTAWGRF